MLTNPLHYLVGEWESPQPLVTDDPVAVLSAYLSTITIPTLGPFEDHDPAALAQLRDWYARVMSSEGARYQRAVIRQALQALGATFFEMDL